VTVASGPLWPLIVAAAATEWEAQATATRQVRTASLGVDRDAILVTATTGTLRPIAAAWVLTGHVAALTGDPAFGGVPARIVVDKVTVDVPSDVLAGVAAGHSRRWWARHVTMVIG